MVYLDNAATSWPKPPEVIRAVTRFLTEQSGSPSRAGHALAEAAGRMVRNVRGQIARMLHTDDPDRIILALNATDALNIAIKGALREGDHVICSAVDHNSVSRPLQAMAETGFIELTRLSLTAEGAVDPEAVRRAIRPDTRLVALNHASNVTGVIQPAADIGRIAREHDLLFLVDASQSAGLLDLDVAAMNVDLLAFPGHKSLLGPTGTGALYVGPRADLRPFREGGTGADSATPTQPRGLPVHLEAGTPNTVGFAGLSAALELLDPAEHLRRGRELCRILLDALAEREGIRLAFPWGADRCVPIVSFRVEGMAPDEVAAVLDQSFRIAVRPGLHCAPYVHRAMGTFPEGTVRVAPGWANTPEHMDRCAKALIEVAAAGVWR
ncbi:MAG: aminotransferase class V-fold PLP-dependent enzyme [Planctomycetota bacterium]|nr:MAG: aminotransferase class V-fold PLP-dependent enzyme [Planctomycetota bacterium]